MSRLLSTWMLVAICGALVLVIGALVAIQYQWSVRVAEADLQREKDHLDSSASLFTSRFNEIVTQTAQFLRQEVRAAVQSGNQLGSTPQLIGELYLFEVLKREQPRSRLLNAAGLFTPTPRPEWLTNSPCTGLVVEWPPAIVVQIQDPVPASRPRDAGSRGLQRLASENRCFLARIDRAYLADSLFPELLRESFGDAAMREYDFAVVIPDRPKDALYGVPLRSRRPDLRKRFFTTLSTLHPDHALIFRDTAGALMKGQPASLPALNNGVWELSVSHKGSPLATALQQRSRRILLYSLGLEALLATAFVFLVVGARRMQCLADQKMTFVAGVSHELRTPVASIALLARNQADGLAVEPDRVKHYGELIHQQARRLNEVIEQTLQYAGLHSDLGRRVHEPIDTRRLVLEAVEERRAELERRGIQVEMAIDGDLPSLSGDATLLRTAVANLIDNAVKHAAAGRWIRVTTVYSTAEKEVRVAVEDRGAGIDPAERSEIFEPFSRGRAAVELQTPGTGLGLSLVRSAVQAHRGEVTLVSERGRGSTFTLHLPI